uniref:Uncharacterized protein n=1 Tax=Arundo donax TaxID=35708 RepID=A0A0A8ZXK0_ARUDO
MKPKGAYRIFLLILQSKLENESIQLINL